MVRARSDLIVPRKMTSYDPSVTVLPIRLRTRKSPTYRSDASILVKIPFLLTCRLKAADPPFTYFGSFWRCCDPETRSSHDSATSETISSVSCSKDLRTASWQDQSTSVRKSLHLDCGCHIAVTTTPDKPRSYTNAGQCEPLEASNIE